MESSNLFQKLPSPPSFPVPPYPFVGIAALVMFYALIMHLIVDFDRHRSEEDRSRDEILSTDYEDSFGLSLEEIQKLPWFTYEVDLSSICAVCLDCLQNGDLCRMFSGCRHVFHAKCIDLWLVRRLTCPTCRCFFTLEADLDVV